MNADLNAETTVTTDGDGKPVLYLLLTGSRPSGQCEGFITGAQRRWRVCVVATPDALKFIDADRLADVTGCPVRSAYKHPDEPDVAPPPDALVVAPATFNTINKWAAGISDTLVTGYLCEAIGQGLPVVAAPYPNIFLRQHPAFRRNVDLLRDWGVRVIWSDDLYGGLTPRAGSAAATMFEWERVAAALDLVTVERGG